MSWYVTVPRRSESGTSLDAWSSPLKTSGEQSASVSRQGVLLHVLLGYENYIKTGESVIIKPPAIYMIVEIIKFCINGRGFLS